MIKLIKKIDIFGHPIGVQFRGQETHPTLCGSLCSLFTIVCVMIFAAAQLYATLNHMNQEVSSIKITTDLDQEDPVDLKTYDFNFLVQFVASLPNGIKDYNFKMPEEIGKLSLIMHTTRSASSDSKF